MSLQYVHLLIPHSPQFVPQPGQVAKFLEELTNLGSAPLQATLRIGKPSGTVRAGLHPLSGERIDVPVREFVPLEDISDIPARLAGVNDYDLVLSGHGPGKLPPFSLHTTDVEKARFTGTYGYELHCCLRGEAVSTCDTPPFGSPCVEKTSRALFHHPYTRALIEVANAACARFWIEFQFGKWLLPDIGNDLNLIQPEILSVAESCLGITFAQGCLYG